MQPTEISQSGVLELIGQSGLLVQLVLVSLIFLSILCWGIVISKYRTIKRAMTQDVGFLNVFWNGKNLEEISDQLHEFPKSPVAHVFRSGYRELKKLNSIEDSSGEHPEMSNVSRSLYRASHAEIAGLERHIGWLATTASAAPFIGLFGTVWGIMNSFQDIGQSGSANLAVVAPGISEALIATAAGLAAAIPAVMAYNHFVQKIKRVSVDLDCFIQDFLNIIQRSLMGKPKK